MSTSMNQPRNVMREPTKTVVAEAVKQSWQVEDYLNNTDYSVPPDYVPSDFALKFVNFIKLVNGAQGEENKTPIVHYYMLDTITKGGTRIINLCHRGIAKTTVMAEYLFLYIACFGEIDGFGDVTLALYVSDSIDNGVKNMRKNLEFRYGNSEFLKHYVPEAKFTDIRWEFKNVDGHLLIVKGYGAQALPLNTTLFTDTGTTTMGECSVGDLIMGADGQLVKITEKSEVFDRPIYRLHLQDGRLLDVSEDHINSVVINTNPNNALRLENKNLTILELLQLPLFHRKKSVNSRTGVAYTSSKHLVFIQNCEPLEYSEKEFPLDPYTVGLLLGDGSCKKDGSVVLHAHKDDMPHYLSLVPYRTGSHYLDKRNGTVLSVSFLGLSQTIRDLGMVKHCNYKEIPVCYLYGSVSQRLALLQGLIDTDGSVTPTGRIAYTSNSRKLTDGLAALVRSLGGTAYVSDVVDASHRSGYSKVEFTLPMQCASLPRKVARLCKRPKYTGRVGVLKIELVKQVPSQCIAVDNADRQYIAGEYVRTHNTGVRGAKELGTRPQLAILDDLVSDEDARSSTVIAAIEATVYKAVTYALHPKKNMIIWSGTPFNAKDPLYKAVESGAWAVNVFPVCERFPCTKEEFRGSWPDRFTFEYVLEQYETAVKSNMVETFNQELMLRIMSEEDRLIKDAYIKWYKIEGVLNNKSKFNFYITTDFATSEKQKADFSVISVWAYNNAGDWFWVDGVCKRQDMGDNINDLFRLAQKWKPDGVGIEITGQQGGFIPWINEKMMEKNVYFNITSDGNGNLPGIRPNTNKMVRFNTVLPWFKAGKFYFPQEMKHTAVMVEAMNELSLAATSGFRSKHDDFLDTISMLSSMKAWRPSEEAPIHINEDDGIWDLEDTTPKSHCRASYTV